MSHTLHSFVDKIVKQAGGSQNEKDDLYEELMIHLEISTEQFINEGFTKEQAEQKAMEHFGDAGEIGNQIQQAMFPFRKRMMLILATVSLVFSFGTFIAQLLLGNNTLIIWLIVSIVNSSLMLISAIKSVPYLKRRFWLNTIYIIHLFAYSYGWMLASDMEHSISIVLTLLSWFIILLAVALLYLTTINDYHSSMQTLYKQANRLHVLNMTTGIVLVITTLFFLWGILAFGEWEKSMIKIFIPLLIWMIAYILQISLLPKYRKVSYAIAMIPILILAGTIVLQVILWRP